MPESALSIGCIQCGKRFRIKATAAGRKLRCPTAGCGNLLVIPAQQTEVLELDDEPPSRPQAQRRPVPDELEDEASESQSDRSPLFWAGIAAGSLLLLATLVGTGYWLFGTRKAAREEESASGTSAGSGTPVAPAPPGRRTVLASGPRVTLGEKLPDSIKVRQYYVSGEFRSDSGYGAPSKDWPQTLPAGTESIRIGIAFEFEPPNGTQIEVEVEGESGPIKLGGGGMLTIRGPEGVVVELARGSLNGAFPDGRYQTTIRLAGKKAAVLNWAVGERVATVLASGLSGTTWHQRGSRDSGYRFEFKADGTLTVEVSWEMGAKRTGKWKAEGDFFTGHVDGLPGKDGRMDFRGQCLKDEIRVRSRRADDSWYPLGVFVKDDGSPRVKTPSEKFGGDEPLPGKKDFDPPPPKGKDRPSSPFDPS